MELTAANIESVLKDCLFKDEEVPDRNNLPPHVKGEGAMLKVGFHPKRLESHRDDVRSMLGQLSDDFMHDKGGGMSMLNMVATKDGRLYGEQITADRLFVLANALGLAKPVLPREVWSMLPGGMPYIVVTL